MALSRRQQTLIRSLRTRHGRKKERLCLCEGLRACGELFAALPVGQIDFIAATADFLNSAEGRSMSFPMPPVEVDKREFDALSGTVTSQGILAVAQIPLPPPDGDPIQGPFLLALDRVGDPGNFGTISRTAKAAGLKEIWYTAGSIDPFGDKAIRAGMGAQFSMRLREFPTLAALGEAAAQAGYGPLYVTDPHGGENLFSAPGIYDRGVLVIGGESNGADFPEGCRSIHIPMPGGFESLNAAQAATITIFEYVRRVTTVAASLSLNEKGDTL
ncbi:MAG: RNA methyltransferase [Victivallaceae bacterium]|nr:RNA methyltransferase [Victivallaceae bacterium]